MRICFVGPANSTHIIKWSNWFTSHGHEIHVISFTPGEIESATIHLVDAGVDADSSDFKKLKYLLTGGKIRRIINGIHPDVVSVHYATSYGMAMALSALKGYVLSVWGSDIYEFPNKSLFHRLFLKFSLKRAGKLLSTSRAMAKEAEKYTSRKFEITPFGVDMNLFNPNQRTRENDNCFIVGTVKGLSDNYGIRNILEAVSIIKQQGVIPIRLRIAGKGPQEQEYRELAQNLGIEELTTWLGFISQEQAAIEWANFDLALIPSVSESFGVSAIEAQACGTATVISDIPGLMEATSPNNSSIVVKRNDSEALANAITDLYKDSEKRIKLGKNGREYVLINYSIDICFKHIEMLFDEYVKDKIV